jgi:hypothetical protein
MEIYRSTTKRATEQSILLYVSHPCADMIKQNINEQFEHKYKVYSYEERIINKGTTTKEELRNKYFTLCESTCEYFDFNSSRINNFKHKKQERARIQQNVS